MNRRPPNISLQRTGAGAPAAELGSFGVRARALAVVLAIGLAATGCSTSSHLLGSRLEYAKSCRGWVTIPEPAQELSHVSGVTILRDTGDLLPNVDLILLDRTSQVPLYLVRSKAKGQFDFGTVPEGKYLLKTCLDGFCTIEIEVTVTAAARKPPLRIAIPLAS
jgi:hypothetical protein